VILCKKSFSRGKQAFPLEIPTAAPEIYTVRKFNPISPSGAYKRDTHNHRCIKGPFIYPTNEPRPTNGRPEIQAKTPEPRIIYNANINKTSSSCVFQFCFQLNSALDIAFVQDDSRRYAAGVCRVAFVNARCIVSR
jgi:hypothetical protein